MYIDNVLIDPGHGYYEAKKYGTGHNSGKLLEVELVDNYILGICDELDLEGIRWHVLETRKSPGLSDAARQARCQPGMLVLSCHIGEMRLDSVPASTVLCGKNPRSEDFAEKLAKAMVDWGKQVNWLHTSIISHDTPQDGVLASENIAVQIEPFPINAPCAMDYAARLDVLGRAIGRTVAAYAKSISPNLGPHPIRVREKPWLSGASQTR
jgi:N-acetylmuramoyl-L-alanine amidase